LARLLAHPATRGLDLDSPETTALRREIVQSKPFLHAIYDEWYGLIVDRLPNGKGRILELGAGGGFLAEYIPDLLTSELFPLSHVDRVIDARSLPFADRELRAIVMTNVFHHIPEVERFMSEARRCLRSGGRDVMIEPWNTGWSRFVHQRFHNEAMLPDAPDWSIPDKGPVSGANAALPWIVFERDSAETKERWPELHLTEVRPFMPFRYLASGGLSMRSLIVGCMFLVWRGAERRLGVEKKMAVFALIVVERE